MGCWVPLCSISSRVILFPLSRQLHRLANISRNEWKRITTTKVFNNTKIKNRAIIHFSYKTRFHLTRLLMMMKLASFLLRPCWIGKNTVCCCVWINCLSRRLCVHILENMDGRISTLKGFIFFNCLFFFCWVFPYAAGKVPIPGSFSPFYLLLFFFFSSFFWLGDMLRCISTQQKCVLVVFLFVIFIIHTEKLVFWWFLYLPAFPVVFIIKLPFPSWRGCCRLEKSLIIENWAGRIMLFYFEKKSQKMGATIE